MNPGPFGIPYTFMLGGKWKVRWGDVSGDVLDSRSEWGVCVHADRTIILNPSLRKNEDMAWEIFSHELAHALSESGTGKGRLSEANVERIQKPLAEFLRENFEWKPK